MLCRRQLPKIATLLIHFGPAWFYPQHPVTMAVDASGDSTTATSASRVQLKKANDQPQAAASWTSAHLKVDSLKVNGLPAALENGLPIIEGDGNLVFAWRVNCVPTREDTDRTACRGARANSYRVVIARSPQHEHDEVVTYYDSAHTISTATMHVVDGALLPADTRFRWELTVDSEDVATTTGANFGQATAHGHFQTALTTALDWGGATWIAGFTQARASFTVFPNTTITSATAYASGLGCFDLFLNGQKVADSMMDPGWSTIPPMRLLYRAYNVTSLLTAGENAAGVRLGFCHYGYVDQAFCVEGHAMRDTCRGFVMRLSIKFANGKTQDVLTTADGAGGATWTGTVSANPMVYSHLYHGEVWDSRMEQKGWNQPSFSGATSANGWEPVKLYKESTKYEGPNQPGLQMSLHEMPTMGVGERRQAINITRVMLPTVSGRMVVGLGSMKRIAGGYYGGGHAAPAFGVKTVQACKMSCLDIVTCVQSTWSTIAPPAQGTMKFIPGGYFDVGKSGSILPKPNVTSEIECKQACLGIPNCVQITWTPPRNLERCDLYLDASDPAKFVKNADIHGWYRSMQCDLYSGVNSTLVSSTSVDGWVRQQGQCAAGVTAGGVVYPSGCAWWHDQTTNTKHFVRNCAIPAPGFPCPKDVAQCWKKTSQLAAGAVHLSDDELAAIPVGRNFTCDMVPFSADCMPYIMDSNRTVHTWVFDVSTPKHFLPSLPFH